MKTIAQQLNIKDFPFTIRDKKGRQIYYEASYGYWIKYEYDSNDNLIHCEYSDGHWAEYEYDSNGNQTFSEDSKGHIIDNRPKNTFTIKELAEKLGVPVETLRIKD